jgi:hypothetical protein
VLRRVRPAVIGAAIAIALAAGTVAADPGTKVLDASLAGIETGGQSLLGIPGGGLPWVLDRGDARLFADGRLEVTVDNLVLAAGGAIGTNPIPTGRAIIVCNGGADVVMTDVVPFSPEGDAQVHATLALPSPCLAPAVLFAGQTGAGPRWFAVTGS